MILIEKQELERMPPRKIKKYEGRKYFSTKEAAEYTGMYHQTFKHHAYIQNRIIGTKLGTSRVFTREQLDDYVANDNQTRMTTGRLELSDAAIYLDVSEDGLKTAVEEGRLPVSEYGGNLLFTQEQLDDFHRSGGRTDIKPVIPFFSMSEAADFAGLSEEAMKQHIYVLKNLPTTRIGRNILIERADLEQMLAEKRPWTRRDGD